MDKVYDMEGLKVYVDATSLTYLNGCTVDYLETLEGAGFKFENPKSEKHLRCGSSFSVCLASVNSASDGNEQRPSFEGLNFSRSTAVYWFWSGGKLG
jgi:hypothetical protein